MSNLNASSPETPYPGTVPEWAVRTERDVYRDEIIAWTHYGPVHTAAGVSVHLERIDLVEGRDALDAGRVEVTIETNGWPIDFSLHAAAQLPDLIRRAIGEATLLEMLRSDPAARSTDS